MSNNTYTVRVTVGYEYEVEASSEDEAYKQGYNYGGYSQYAEVYEVTVEEHETEEEE